MRKSAMASGHLRRPAGDDLSLAAGDRLLLGTDLVKPIGQLLLAYDDPTGVTAAFNLNLLGRINDTIERVDVPALEIADRIVMRPGMAHHFRYRLKRHWHCLPSSAR